jgi:hypothetical protein
MIHVAVHPHLIGGKRTPLRKIIPRASLVRELDRQESAEVFGYRKTVLGFGVEDVDDVLRIVIDGA